MAFTKKNYPPFPQNRTSGILDHSAEITQAQAAHYAGKKIPPLKTANQHLKKGKAPEGMESARGKLMEKRMGFPVSNKTGR